MIFDIYSFLPFMRFQAKHGFGQRYNVVDFRSKNLQKNLVKVLPLFGHLNCLWRVVVWVCFLWACWWNVELGLVNDILDRAWIKKMSSPKVFLPTLMILMPIILIDLSLMV